MSEDHFWDRVQSMLDRRLDPLEDDEVAAVFLARPEWAAALVAMTSRVRLLSGDVEGVVPLAAKVREAANARRRLQSWRATTVRSFASLSAAAAMVVVALTLARAPGTGIALHLEPTVVSQAEGSPSPAAVFRVDSFVSRVSTVAPGYVTERAEVVRDGRVVSWSTASELAARDGSFVVRSSSQRGRHLPASWGKPQGASPDHLFFLIPAGRHDGR